MLNVAQHTIYLQDGSLCNFKKRVVKQHKTLLAAFSQVTDGRGNFGKRHDLSLLLLILFAGITSGSTTLKDCHLWALHNKQFLSRFMPLSHGIADPTTISRAIQKVAMDSLVRAYRVWQEIVSGSGKVASFDGKTLNGVHGKEVIKHVLSLFTHEKHQILAQVGVLRKENEIPAARRLFAQVGKSILSGMLLIGDALHTQKDYTFLEDRQTLRSGNAPLVMTFLRSMCISLFAASSFVSVTTTIANFQKNPSLHHLFLKQAVII